MEEGKEEPEVEVEENECDGAVERDDAKLSAVVDVLVQESIEWAQERDERACSLHHACRASDRVPGKVEGARVGAGGLVVLGIRAGARRVRVLLPEYREVQGDFPRAVLWRL